MSKAEILIIDDEPQIRKLLQIALDNNEYKTQTASTGKEGLTATAVHPPDLIILDLGLPDIDGQTVLKQLREWYTKSIIILSVQNSEEEIVKALDNGATDFISKPFRTAELLARIRSAIRKNDFQINQSTFSSDDFSIDFIARSVKINATVIKLTVTEYNLLALLAKNEGRVLTHHYLLKEIWGVGYQTETQYLRVFIGALRKKIETDPTQPKHIITESGIGYRFI